MGISGDDESRTRGHRAGENRIIIGIGQDDRIESHRPDEVCERGIRRNQIVSRDASEIKPATKLLAREHIGQLGQQDRAGKQLDFSRARAIEHLSRWAMPEETRDDNVRISDGSHGPHARHAPPGSPCRHPPASKPAARRSAASNRRSTRRRRSSSRSRISSESGLRSPPSSASRATLPGRLNLISS
jgi:hypothetical protein